MEARTGVSGTARELCEKSLQETEPEFIAEQSIDELTEIAETVQIIADEVLAALQTFVFSAVEAEQRNSFGDFFINAQIEPDTALEEYLDKLSAFGFEGKNIACYPVIARARCRVQIALELIEELENAGLIHTSSPIDEEPPEAPPLDMNITV
jgi:hypothetical protein